MALGAGDAAGCGTSMGRPMGGMARGCSSRRWSLLSSGISIAPAFADALPGHLPPDSASQARIATVTSTLKEIASL
jgi:hypothetical protein